MSQDPNIVIMLDGFFAVLGILAKIHACVYLCLFSLRRYQSRWSHIINVINLFQLLFWNLVSNPIFDMLLTHSKVYFVVWTKNLVWKYSIVSPVIGKQCFWCFPRWPFVKPDVLKGGVPILQQKQHINFFNQ